MNQLKYSYDYLLQQLRQKDIFNLSKVEFAVLEPNGKLSVQLKSQNRPLTPKDLDLDTQYEGLATELILEGQILESSLESNDLSVDWLMHKLKELNIGTTKEVAFAALSTNGEFYVDLYDDSGV